MMMSSSTADRARLRCDFFVLRTPLFPLGTLSQWADGLDALGAASEDDDRLAEALESDRALLRERLARLAADEWIAAGIELSSESLARGLGKWRSGPGTKEGRSAERSLVRYITRAASRSDLFGLAAAYTVGRFGVPPTLVLGPRAELRVNARVDSGLIQEVVRRAAAAAVTRDDLLVRRNRGAYRVGGRLRVAARRAGSSSHRLVAMRPTPNIELALEVAGDGASIDSILAALEAAGTPRDRGRALVHRLLASDMVVPVAQISVTGPEPAVQALAALALVPDGEPYAAAVRRASAAVPPTARPSRATIDNVVRAIEPTGVEVDRRRCLQVDARWDGEVTLPPSARSEMARAVGLLARIAPPAHNALDSFKEAFERRFGTRSVPLLQALDPDFGLRMGGGAAGAAPVSDARQRALLALIERGRSAPDAGVELTRADIAALSRDRPAVLPGAFALLTRLTGRDAAAVAAGAFQLVEPIISGPSGARAMGRFCHGDPELEAHIREHLRREAALVPDAIFAELSVAPETEFGLSLSQRPVLREWEIEYGGGSGAPEARRIDPGELRVCVEDGEVVLRSSALGRPVVPCCTTAVNLWWISLPAARFMLSIAQQNVSCDLCWHWGELADAPELPRVTHRRTILALRRWTVPAGELSELRAESGAAGFRRLQEWRRARGLPRAIGFDHPKSRMLVDFGNVLSIDAFLAAAKDVDVMRFVETLAGEPSPVHGPDGEYAHELIVPFTLERAAAPRRRRSGARTPVANARRRFEPGSEWLYANLYGPVAAADEVLIDHVGPLARGLRAAGSVDRWFFIRYADPASHLRVRFHGRPRELIAEALPALHEATAPLLAADLLYRISLDTYEREVERYGGLEGVELMERLAEADSEAVIEILGHKASGVERRHLAVASVAALYADAGLPIERRHACCNHLRSAWPLGGAALGAQLGAQERSERPTLAAILDALEEDEPEPQLAALRKRSEIIAPVMARMRSLEDERRLEAPIDDVMSALAHMAVNRLLVRGANADEVRVHDALARIYESQMARMGGFRRARPRSSAVLQGADQSEAPE
jgi:thiopeptide-type bacteriocin biosynthesis protein